MVHRFEKYSNFSRMKLVKLGASVGGSFFSTATSRKLKLKKKKKNGVGAFETSRCEES